MTVYVHKRRCHPLLMPVVKKLCREHSRCRVIPLGGSWFQVQAEMLKVMQSKPDDWFVIADQDEFHLYPGPLEQVAGEAERKSYDSVAGCLVDRIAQDGSIQALDVEKSIWEQYPTGALLTYPICRADFRKIVLAKGRTRFTNPGHHEVAKGSVMPMNQILIEVHHFKWIGGIVEYLRDRRSPHSPFEGVVRREDRRFIKYLRIHQGRIPLEEPAFMAAKCTPYYPRMDAARTLCLLLDFTRRADRLRVASMNER